MQHTNEPRPAVLTDRRSPSRRGRVLAVALVVALLAVLLGTVASDAEADGSEAVVVANRGSGDISVIDTTTLAVNTIDLPGDAEPMYVNHDPVRGLVFVGDRATDSVLALDDITYEVVATLPVGEGVFHQWYDRRHLWVVGDVANTVTVINTKRLQVVDTIHIPAEIVERGGKPHDVFVRGAYAFVSIVGLDDDSGIVLRYSAETRELTGHIDTGGDPHLFIFGPLFVASQADGKVTSYNVRSLEQRDQIDAPGAHGIYVTPNWQVHVTNISGGGVDALSRIDHQLSVVRKTVDTDLPVPHNITFDSQKQFWVTHSGPTVDGQVSVVPRTFNPSVGFGEPQTVAVGTNPFGLATVRPR